MAYHILNGDALAMQLEGCFDADELYICRECLIDGPVKADSLEDFFQMRIEYLSKTYEIDAVEGEEALAEFDKIRSIPKNSKVYLWFEEDLFCQLNFWFCCSLLKEKNLSLYLVLPKASSPYSFGHMRRTELLQAHQFANTISSTDLDLFGKLWKAFQMSDYDQLSALILEASDTWPFLPKAGRAVLELKQAVYEKSLSEIIEQVDENRFGPVFQLFSSQFAFLGMGDLQLKRMYDEIVNIS
jgi:hypothetical protein